MTTADARLTDPRMVAAIEELTGLIRAEHPTAEFSAEYDEDECSVFVIATVDVDDTDEVMDLFLDRILTLQEEEGLRLHVIPVHTPARNQRQLAEMDAKRSPRSAVG